MDGGFPGLKQLNEIRRSCYNVAYNKSENGQAAPDCSTRKRIGCWTAHKSLSIVLIPTNAFLGVGGGFAAMAVTSVFGGILTFALRVGSFGHWKKENHPKYTTFFKASCRATGHSLDHLCGNMDELVKDYFFGLKKLNHIRETCAEKSHDRDEVPNKWKRFGYYTAHKALSVASFPLNAAFGIAGGSAIASPLMGLAFVNSSVKLVTLGKYEPEYSTGYVRSCKGTARSIAAIFVNIWELMKDGGHLVAFQGKRVFAGFIMAAENEIAPEDSKTPIVLRWLDSPTKKRRLFQDGHEESRTYAEIITHYGLSFVNMPLNAGFSLLCGITSIATCSFFMGKVLFSATTNQKFPAPSFALHTLGGSFKCAGNVFKDLGTCFADNFVLMYKIAADTGCIKILTTVGTALLHLPGDCFEA